MKRLALAIVLVLGFAPPAWADFQAGFAAWDRGDYATAIREFRPLAEQGNVHAQFNLGVMYDNGQGVPQDYAEAVKWYRLAAEQGDADAQNNLGQLYSHGQGVPQDYTEAVKWYRLAAEQGSGAAQSNLGAMYGFGHGIPRDYTEAVKWNRLAAEQGESQGQFNLALYYDYGRGVPQDYAEALKWYRKAARQGDPEAQVNLGVMYDKGEGLPQDYVQAHKWYNLAASRLSAGEHRDLAVKYRDIVAKKMTAAQIAEAQRLARDWKSKTQAASKLNLLLEAERRGTLPAKKKALLDEARRRGLIPDNQTPPPVATSETIRSIQTSLSALDYNSGPADGILGPRTRSAIEAFQRDHSMPVTGKATTQLRDLLWVEKILNPAGPKPKKVELSD